jgi:hypothetical protein
MSGLGNKVKLEARQGKIIISKVTNARAGWDTQIEKLASEKGDPSDEFKDMNVAEHDGLEDMVWDGPSFEEWQRNNAKLS